MVEGNWPAVQELRGQIDFWRRPAEANQPSSFPGQEEWKQWSEDMRKSSLELAQALKDYKAADIKSAVKKVNESCINCHGPFRQ